jgi:hypothetical protein
MRRAKLLPLTITFLLTAFCLGISAQETVIKKEDVNSIIDSLAMKRIITRRGQEKQEINFTREQALKYLNEKYRSGNWADPVDPFRMAMGQLVYFASHPPVDSAIRFMRNYSFDSINIPWEKFYKWDSLKMKIPVVLPQGFILRNDSIVRGDTIAIRQINDSLALQIEKLPADSVAGYRAMIPKPTVIMKDTVFMYISDTLAEVLPDRKGVPFLYYKYPYQVDSISVAIRSLSEYLISRDSSIIQFNSISGAVIPVWLNSKTGNMSRYWLRNEFADSVTIWIGSTGRDSIGMYLEEGIMFRRPSKQTNISDAQLNLKKINSAKLQEVNKIYIKPHYWTFKSESALVLNQAFLSNWVKGGESSISTTMDITGYANYNNKKLRLSSSNFGRIKYGLVATDKQGVRKNLDLLETNSKLNHKAFGKVDFSGTVLFKTQLTVGKSYFKVGDKDTSVVASKFMNPATLTIGLGFDYKPNKNTSINFAPLTYKGTFVMDTANIDQTKYGIPNNKRSLNEPGVSLQITNEFKPYKTITVTNRLQLFTSYIHNPQNVDIDWEMIATLNLNWFTDVRLNTHLIYDDDTKTAKLDKKDNPILGPDLKPLRSAKAQFKELIGFSFVFRF